MGGLVVGKGDAVEQGLERVGAGEPAFDGKAHEVRGRTLDIETDQAHVFAAPQFHGETIDRLCILESGHEQRSLLWHVGQEGVQHSVA